MKKCNNCGKEYKGLLDLMFPGFCPACVQTTYEMIATWSSDRMWRVLMELKEEREWYAARLPAKLVQSVLVPFMQGG